MKLRLFATLRNLAGARELEMEAPPTAGALLDELSRQWGKAFDDQIVDDEGRLLPGVIVLVNGRHIAHLNGRETPLSDGDAVDLFPPLAGG